MQRAPCGLDCDACPQKPEHCDGCHAESGRVWSADCPIRLCCKSDRQLANCSLCADFPCQVVLDFESDGWDHHAKAVGTLREMRKQS